MSPDLVAKLVTHAEIGVLLVGMAWMNLQGRVSDQVMVSALLATLGALGVNVVTGGAS